MEVKPTMESKNATTFDTESSGDHSLGESSSVIYIDPAKEAACRRKFDIYVVPVSVIFLVLSTLDRNNVSTTFIPKFHSHSLTVH